MNKQYFDFCEWICEEKSKRVFDSKGQLTPAGKKLIEILEKNPDAVLHWLHQNIEKIAMFYIVQTEQGIFVPDSHKLCEEVLESLKKRFLPQKV